MNSLVHEFALSAGFGLALLMACGVEDRSVQEGSGGSGTSGAGGSAAPVGGTGPNSGGSTNASGGDAGASDGGGDGGGSAGSGGSAGRGGSAGSDGSGGDAGAPADEPGVGTFGEPCSPNGARACAGHNQRIQLQCLDGVWGGDDMCASGSLCDTAQENRGLCQPIYPDCETREPGELFCDENERVACGVDRVDITTLETCYACRPEACYCPAGTAVAAGQGADRCAACAAGTYSSAENAASCTTWTACAPGQYVSQAGTPTTDRACTACALGTVSLGQNETSCSISQIVAGGLHTCALLTNGSVRCWGDGASGKLGQGSTTDIGDNELPNTAPVVDVGGPVVQLSAGLEHTCALLTTGNVRCWGEGSLGRLGYENQNDIGDTELPSTAGDVNVGGQVAQIAAGGSHTCALLTDGNVRCWGDGTLGRLGYGNVNNIGDNEPPSTAGDVDVGGQVAQISAGFAHTCAVLTTGAVRCWGEGSGGKLGYANQANVGDNETPDGEGDVNVGVTAAQIAAGLQHTCALLTTGNVRCWGTNSQGQLGYPNVGAVGASNHPVSAGDVDVGGAVAQIATGSNHTCALLVNGSTRCWGDGVYGQLGHANVADIGDDETPAVRGNITVGGAPTQIAAGGNHTCALLKSGTGRCWGQASSGQLGYGNTNAIGDTESPASAGNVPFL